ncbi:MAG TPA: hypothetical protein VGN93_30900 [Shinella sp.]|jgi:hypothetical protein|uniref:hypothetical protein n=1 Tax=Shinella sp. TaxID=1870904 RepID=UPI002E15ADE6|nr:hypothetical protein [Shinella sp.]
MKEMDFPEEFIEAGGQRVMAAKIECSGCAAVGYYPRKRGAARRPPAAIVVHFRKQGWNLKGARVRCPECARRRPRAEEEGKSMVKTVHKRAAPVVAFGVPVDPATIADSVVIMPPAASLEDKQLINMKLMEVYDNPDVGYRPGWSDSIVARDLGVRTEWVADVRSLMFGPPGSSPQLDAFFEAAAEAEKRFADLRTEQAAACRTVDSMRSDLEKLGAEIRTNFAELRDFVANVQKQGEAIKTGLGR